MSRNFARWNLWLPFNKILTDAIYSKISLVVNRVTSCGSPLWSMGDGVRLTWVLRDLAGAISELAAGGDMDESVSCSSESSTRKQPKSVVTLAPASRAKLGRTCHTATVPPVPGWLFMQCSRKGGALERRTWRRRRRWFAPSWSRWAMAEERQLEATRCQGGNGCRHFASAGRGPPMAASWDQMILCCLRWVYCFYFTYFQMAFSTYWTVFFVNFLHEVSNQNSKVWVFSPHQYIHVHNNR